MSVAQYAGTLSLADNVHIANKPSIALAFIWDLVWLEIGPSEAAAPKEEDGIDAEALALASAFAFGLACG